MSSWKPEQGNALHGTAMKEEPMRYAWFRRARSGPAFSGAPTWFLIRNMLLLTPGALSMLAALRCGHAGWWLGVALAALLAIAHAVRCAPRPRPRQHGRHIMALWCRSQQQKTALRSELFVSKQKRQERTQYHAD
jgi:hypothetical protein